MHKNPKFMPLNKNRFTKENLKSFCEDNIKTYNKLIKVSNSLQYDAAILVGSSEEVTSDEGEKNEETNKSGIFKNILTNFNLFNQNSLIDPGNLSSEDNINEEMPSNPTQLSFYELNQDHLNEMMKKGNNNRFDEAISLTTEDQSEVDSNPDLDFPNTRDTTKHLNSRYEHIKSKNIKVGNNYNIKKYKNKTEDIKDNKEQSNTSCTPSHIERRVNSLVNTFSNLQYSESFSMDNHVKDASQKVFLSKYELMKKRKESKDKKKRMIQVSQPIIPSNQNVSIENLVKFIEGGDKKYDKAENKNLLKKKKKKLKNDKTLDDCKLAMVSAGCEATNQIESIPSSSSISPQPLQFLYQNQFPFPLSSDVSQIPKKKNCSKAYNHSALLSNSKTFIPFSQCGKKSLNFLSELCDASVTPQNPDNLFPSTSLPQASMAGLPENRFKMIDYDQVDNFSDDEIIRKPHLNLKDDKYINYNSSSFYKKSIASSNNYNYSNNNNKKNNKNTNINEHSKNSELDQFVFVVNKSSKKKYGKVLKSCSQRRGELKDVSTKLKEESSDTNFPTSYFSNCSSTSFSSSSTLDSLLVNKQRPKTAPTALIKTNYSFSSSVPLKTKTPLSVLKEDSSLNKMKNNCLSETLPLKDSVLETKMSQVIPLSSPVQHIPSTLSTPDSPSPSFISNTSSHEALGSISSTISSSFTTSIPNFSYSVINDKSKIIAENNLTSKKTMKDSNDELKSESLTTEETKKDLNEKTQTNVYTSDRADNNSIEILNSCNNFFVSDDKTNKLSAEFLTQENKFTSDKTICSTQNDAKVSSSYELHLPFFSYSFPLSNPPFNQVINLQPPIFFPVFFPQPFFLPDYPKVIMDYKRVVCGKEIITNNNIDANNNKPLQEQFQIPFCDLDYFSSHPSPLHFSPYLHTNPHFNPVYSNFPCASCPSLDENSLKDQNNSACCCCQGLLLRNKNLIQHNTKNNYFDNCFFFENSLTQTDNTNSDNMHINNNFNIHKSNNNNKNNNININTNFNNNDNNKNHIENNSKIKNGEILGDKEINIEKYNLIEENEEFFYKNKLKEKEKIGLEKNKSKINCSHGLFSRRKESERSGTSSTVSLANNHSSANKNSSIKSCEKVYYNKNHYNKNNNYNKNKNYFINNNNNNSNKSQFNFHKSRYFRNKNSNQPPHRQNNNLFNFEMVKRYLLESYMSSKDKKS